MGKTHLNVSVSTYETEFDMQLRPSATGKNLFDAITATTGIREVWRSLFLAGGLIMPVNAHWPVPTHSDSPGGKGRLL